jgi:ribosomal protein RSM22 (predicted rRNA methylase)
LILQKTSEESEGEGEEKEDIEKTAITPNVSDEWDRVLFPLIRKGQHFIYTLCSKSGKFDKRITSKSHGLEYKLGKKLKWGDLWRFGVRIPNRYRK